MKIVRKNLLSIIVAVTTLFLVVQHVVYAVTVSTSTMVYITAQVVGGSNPGGGGGTGGTGGTGTTTGGIPATVNFSGMAYPSSKVVVLQDGRVVVNTVADPNANFSASITGLSPGTYNFSLYAQDSNGNHSASFSFPLYLTAGATINIGGVILSPTIDVEKSEVKRGDNEPIFGFAPPNSQVNIAVHSDDAHFVTATANALGAYLYNFDTTPLEYGDHNAQSRALLGQKVSAETNPVAFKVSDQNKGKTPSCSKLIGDINCDGHVNLVDFSILAYWYKKGTTPPTNVDLNGDGKVTLVDFSIMAYHWTG